MPNSLIHIETRTSQMVIVKDLQLRVRSQVVQFRLPIVSGGLIWNRPVAVVIQTADRQDQTLPIRDVTRMAVLALMTLCLANLCLLILFRRRTA